MRTIALRTLAAGTLTLVTLAGAASAQTPSPILNALELRKLVESSEPADNARLSVHFATLADRYAADARRHTAMAQAFISAPARRTPANSAADHCKRLATLNAQSAETLRELAAYHEKLAAGVSSAPPRTLLDARGAQTHPTPTTMN